VRLLQEMIPDVEVPGTLAIGRDPEARKHLRTHFIAASADPYATMHYNIGCRRPGSGGQVVDPPLQDPSGGSPPPGVQERDATAGNHQVDGNTIGHCDGEEYTGRGRGPAVDSVAVYPPASSIQAAHLDTVDLIAEGKRLELLHRSPEGEPAAHDLADRLVAPETQVEATTCDPGDHSV
jgi:hypothetical protein